MESKVNLNKPIRDYREAVKTNKEPYSLTEIPLESLKREGAIFRQGDIKYGRANWRNGVYDKAYQLDRCNKAIKHLLIYAHYLETGEYIGEVKKVKEPKERGVATESDPLAQYDYTTVELKEDDLAKVAWFCHTQMELERLESK